MARRGSVRVSITGDADGLGRATRDAENKLDRLGKAGGRTMRGLGNAAKLGGAALAAGLATGLTASAKAAIEAEKSQARLTAQLKASGISWEQHRNQIDATIQKHSQLSGLDDEDLQDSFTNIVRVTGDVNEALRLNALAADFARAKHMDVAKAGELIGKVAGGNVGILGRYGIQLKDNATSADALAVLQQKFAGQAEAYGDTTAGSMDRMKVAGENLAESVGSALAPGISKAAGAVSNFITEMQTGTGAGGKFAAGIKSAFNTVKTGVQIAIKAVRGYIRDHREDLRQAAKAAENVGRIIQKVWNEWVLPVIKRVLPAVVMIVKGGFERIKGFVKVLTGILTLDFGKAWDGVKDIFRGTLRQVAGLLRAASAPFREAASRAFGAISSVVDSTIGAAIRAVKAAVEAVIGTINTAIGKAQSLLDKVKGGKPGVGTGAKDLLGGASGMRVTEPGLFVAGEEAPRHPEFIIATNPRYRRDNLGYLAQAAEALGVQGFKKGKGGAKKRQTRQIRLADKWRKELLPKEQHEWETIELKWAQAEGTATTDDDLFWATKARDFWKKVGRSRKKAPLPFRTEIQNNINRWRNEVKSIEEARKPEPKDPVEPAAPPTALDTLEANIAEAALTGGTADDIRAADALVAYWNAQLAAARASGDPRRIRDAAAGLKGAKDARAGLNVTPEAAAGPTADEIAIRERADLRSYIASRASYLSGAAGYVMRGAGDLYGSGGGVTFNINTLHPGDPNTLRAIGDAAVSGMGMQGYTTSPRTAVG